MYDININITFLSCKAFYEFLLSNRHQSYISVGPGQLYSSHLTTRVASSPSAFTLNDSVALSGVIFIVLVIPLMVLAYCDKTQQHHYHP